MINILLPWSITSGGFALIRKHIFSKTCDSAYGLIFRRGYEEIWLCEAYDINNKPMLNGGTGYTKEDAKKNVDDALIKSGWRLLDKEDKLMVLI